MAEAKIWTVETVPLKPTIGSHLKVKIAVKNVGESGNTLWLGAKKDGEIAIEKGTFGVPPGRTFKWFIIDCGEYTGDSIDIEIEAGHGWQTKDVDDVFDEEIDENGIQYSAGDNEHDPSYQLNKHVQGEGAIENIPTGGFFLEGTTVELRAVKQLGWNFALWMEGDIELGTQNPIEITMDRDRDITAIYTQDSDLPVSNKKSLKVNLLNLSKQLIDTVINLEE